MQVALFAALALTGGISPAQAQGSLTPIERAGRFWADMHTCNVEPATQSLIVRKLYDWARHTERNDNALTCTRDLRGDCYDKMTDMAMIHLCARVRCDKGPPPAAMPDCNVFLPRFKAMRLLSDEWQPRDGLRSLSSVGVKSRCREGSPGRPPIPRRCGCRRDRAAPR
jgi:hypothetical protein